MEVSEAAGALVLLPGLGETAENGLELGQRHVHEGNGTGEERKPFNLRESWGEGERLLAVHRPHGRNKGGNNSGPAEVPRLTR